jgi:hypothetical protein
LRRAKDRYIAEQHVSARPSVRLTNLDLAERDDDASRAFGNMREGARRRSPAHAHEVVIERGFPRPCGQRPQQQHQESHRHPDRHQFLSLDQFAGITLPAIRIHVKVAIKADHPPARQPGERIAPEKNAIRYEADDFLVFEEKLEPGDTRACHSHGERLVIQLNRARLQQWPDGEPARFVETVPERPAFSPPVIHTVHNIGETPLRGIVIEFKAQ